MVELNFQPAAGREIDKRRPAIVITEREYNIRTGFCLAVPITSDVQPGPMWILVPPGFLPRPSKVLCDLIKSIDYRERSIVFLMKLPGSFVDEVVSRILDLIDPVH